jgi:hypothetical protein
VPSARVWSTMAAMQSKQLGFHPSIEISEGMPRLEQTELFYLIAWSQWRPRFSEANGSENWLRERVVGAGSKRGRCLRHDFSPISGSFQVDRWSFNPPSWEQDNSEPVQLFAERGIGASRGKVRQTARFYGSGRSGR